MIRVETAKTGESTDGRELICAQISDALERAARSHARAGIIVVEVDPWRMNTGRIDALCRVQAVLGLWQRYRRDCVYGGSLGGLRAGVVIAPIGYANHAEEVAEQLARALDPRTCPLLRESTPCVWYGTSVYPDLGVEAGTLLRIAESALEEKLRLRQTVSTHFPSASTRPPVRGETLQPS